VSDLEISSTVSSSVPSETGQIQQRSNEEKISRSKPDNSSAPTPMESIADSTVRTSQAVKATEQTISPERMGELIRELEAKLPTTASKGLHFEMDEVLQKPIISVVDKESGQVLRQLPAEEVVRAARNIEYMRGILFDEKS